MQIRVGRTMSKTPKKYLIFFSFQCQGHVSNFSFKLTDIRNIICILYSQYPLDERL